MNRKILIWVAICFVFFTQSSFAVGTGFEWQAEIQLRGSRDDPSSSFFGGSFVQRADGKMLVTYRSREEVLLSVVDSEDELLTVDNASAKNEWVFRTLYSPEYWINDSRLQKLKNGRILLYVVESGVNADPLRPFRVDVYESRNGLGTDFQLKSRMVNQKLKGTTFGVKSIGDAIEVKGRIYVPLAWPVDNGIADVLESNLFCAISSDGGKTWQFDRIAPSNWWRDSTRGIGIAKGKLIVLDQSAYAGGITIFRSKAISDIVVPDPLGEWTAGETFLQKYPNELMSSHYFLASDGYTYFQYMIGAGHEYSVYRRLSGLAIDEGGQRPYEVGGVGPTVTWKGPLNSVAYGDDAGETLLISPSGHVVLVGTTTFRGSASHMYVGRKLQP